MLDTLNKDTLAQYTKNLVADLARRVPTSPRVLAQPPAGSELKPIHGDPGPPVLGHSLGALADLLGLAERQRARFGPISWFGGFDRDVVLVLGPDGIEDVVMNRDGAFSSADGWGYLIGPFFKGGVMLMDNPEHKRHRKIMQAAFKRERLVAYLGSMNPTIADGMAAWQPGENFPLYTRTKQLTLDVGTKVFVGAELGAEADRLNDAFVNAVHGGQAMIRTELPFGAWHRGLEGRRLLERYFAEQIAAKRAGDADDLFSVLCRAESDDGERFSDEEVISHMIFVLMAAHDTSTITLSMMAYYLATHPEWQERLRAESQALGKDAIGYEDLDQLPLMDMAMKETLRINAPVGLLFRETTADTQIAGHYVPAGKLIGVGLYPTMRMEPWWRDPHRFDPERFSEERREDQSHKFAWTPFGGSVHKCIGLHFGGMEVKALLHQMLLRFRWSVPAGFEPLMGFGTGPNPVDGLPITLQRL